MCPDINCKTSDAGHENHPEEVSRKSSRRSLKEDIDNEDANNVIDENVNKTPDLKELLQATAVIPSTVKRRRTRMSAMKAIEESAQEVDNAEEVLTPVSKIISKIKAELVMEFFALFIALGWETASIQGQSCILTCVLLGLFWLRNFS